MTYCFLHVVDAYRIIIPSVDMLLSTAYSYVVDVALCSWWYLFIAAQLKQSYPTLNGG